MAAPGTREPIVVRHDGGLRFDAQVRSHHVVTDQPQRAGGQDGGPTPLELLGAALGTCIALYVQQFCQSRSLPTDGLRVEVVQHGESNPGRIGAFVVRVMLPPDIPARYVELVERVAQSCPVHHTLQQGATVTVCVEAPIAAEL